MKIQERLKTIMEQLDCRGEPALLSPTNVWHAGLDDEIAELGRTHPSTDADKSRIALMAGLHLLNDSLDRSHSYAQQIEDDATGCYWHAIMHRMEQDFWNSKYWFRQAGRHPVKERTRLAVSVWLKDQPGLNVLPAGAIVNILKQFRNDGSWNCDEFVDLISLQESGKGSDETHRLLQGLQRIELAELFRYTLDAAN
ncbi:hypothetical protein RB620_29605 [Paenibacillus sp. LHD-117]|uniref:hypothetical protein n=1 Tax=Paenibacillus sp. LHD-117 TaxID=3071412 RepID=UPI0027E1A8E3|nr:hypothetical protein [Paenibacillus sp. LHD-117]MDQ6423573.1 hypothetical protein [Paenibacillus sp. LHD-117]